MTKNNNTKHKKLITHNEHGAAIVLAVFFAVLIAIIGISIAQVVTIQSSVAANRIRDEKAFYIAEAGVQHAIFKVRKNTTWLTGFPAENFGDGLYSVALAQPSLADDLVVTSAGKVGESTRSLTVRAAYRIETFAGTGLDGYNGDGIPAAAAQLNQPYGVCSDAAGNIYIADTENDRIRRVDRSTGLISTAAGTGTSGYSGDGGPATLAELNKPEDVFVHSSGDIYIADTKNYCIRKVDASDGNIYRVAGVAEVSGNTGDGGPALNALLNDPAGVFVDEAGNIYIADRNNHKIRKVNKITGNIFTDAGTGTAGYNGDNIDATTAELNNPSDVWVNEAGDIVIGDTDNHRMRVVLETNGRIFTVAGTGTAGYNGEGMLPTNHMLRNPEGIYMDSGDNFYIADRDNHIVRRIDMTSGTLNNFAGTTVSGYKGDGALPVSCQLKKPVAVCQDDFGNFIVADRDNNVVRKISLVKVNWSTG